MPPEVEMLWEAIDPGVALRDRFGFTDPAEAGHWVMTTVGRHWGVRVDACARIVISHQIALAWLETPDGPRLAKWSSAPDRFPQLRQVADLVSWLHDHGLPVSAPILARDGRRQVEVDDVSIFLQPVITGDLLDVADHDQIRATGAVLARLHQALEIYPDAADVVAPQGTSGLITRIERWLDTAGPHVRVAPRGTLRGLLTQAPAEPPAAQLVHGDVRSANVICAEGEVAAVIDFESVRYDHRVDELARSAVLLGTRYRDWGPVPPEVHAALLAGYQSVRPLTPDEARWWDLLRLWYALAFVPPGDDPTGWGAAATRLAAGLLPRR